MSNWKRLIFLFFIMMLFSFTLISCNEKTETIEKIDYEFSLNKAMLTMYVGEEYEFITYTDYEGEITYELSNKNVSLDDHTLTALKPGTCNLYASFIANNEFYSFTMAITIKDVYLDVLDNLDIACNEEIKLNINTNYKKDLDFLYNDEELEVKKEDGIYFVKALKDGEFHLICKIPGLGDEYSKEIKITSHEYCNLLIDDESYKVLKGTLFIDALEDIFGIALCKANVSYSLEGYYFDSEFTLECDLYSPIENSCELFEKYEKIEYTINLNKVVKYKSTIALTQNVVALTQVAGYHFSDYDLTDYVTYEVRYDIPSNEYVITSEKAVYIPYDGFVLGIRIGSDAYNELRSVLRKGLVLSLNSYNIIASTKLSINKVKEAVSYDINLSLNSKYASVIDVTNNIKAFEKDGDALTYPASTTKMITVMAALRYCNLDDTYCIGDELNLCYEGPTPSVAGIKAGEVWTLRDLLYAVMLPSGNDAAYSVAALTITHLFPENTDKMRGKIDLFATLMNNIAKDCGATNSHFMVPDGNSYYKKDGSWDDRLTYHYVTANDMAKIACYAMSYSTIAEVVKTTYYRCTVNGTNYSFSNTNSLITEGSGYYYSGACGLKTGYTGPAGRCLITACFKKNKFVIVACMNATNGDLRNIDTKNMLNAVYN